MVYAVEDETLNTESPVEEVVGKGPTDPIIHDFLVLFSWVVP